MQLLAKDSVRTLIIPLQGCNLLLPNVAVAEVVAYMRPRAVENAPEWMLGTINWRGMNIPLISYDRLYGAADGNLGQARIAVFNTIDRNSGIKFYAVVTAGIPQLKRITEDMLQQQSEGVEGAVCQLQVGDINTRVPDLAALESVVAQAWKQVA